MGVRYTFIPGRSAKRFDEIKARMKDPMRSAGPAVVKVMRVGPGSTSDQFRRQTHLTGAVAIPWKRTRAFGSRAKPAKTLNVTGTLAEAWAGRNGYSYSEVDSRRVSVGVLPSLRYAGIFQARQDTIVRARKRTSKGKLAMRMFLGMEYGVWIPERTLLRGLRIVPRRVGIGTQLEKRARAVVKKYLLTGAVA